MLASAGLSLEIFTVTPSAGAGRYRETVPTTAVPPVTFEALSVRGGMHGYSAIVLDRRISPAAIEIRTVTPSSFTGLVMIGTLALFALAGMVTLFGTLTTSGRLLLSATRVPPSGAGLAIAANPDAASPPASVRGSNANIDRKSTRLNSS